MNTPRAVIDLAALRHNLTVVRALCPNSRVMAMVKADAYGHGLVRVANALADADGLAVARLPEALQLRSAGISKRILLLGTVLDDAALKTCSEQNIDVTAHDPALVLRIVAIAREAPLRVWLELDSGMHRLGLDPLAFRQADAMLAGHPGILELIHMTHFSSADDLASNATAAQIACFAEHHANSNAQISMANSAALIATPATRTDWVRPGIMLYGDNPLEKTHPLPLRTVMTLRASIIALRDVGIGESVGYNRTWTSTRASIIATVGIGYGDGYPRHASNGTPVWINGCMAPLVGRVSMDSLTIDVTDCGSVAVGDEATLWGPQLPVAVIAKQANTITYDLLTAIGRGVGRDYIDA